MKEAKSVTLEYINFDAESVASKEKQQFVKEMMPTKNFGGFDEAKRKSLFEKAHALCTEAVKPKAKPAEKPAT
jgi:hypothetical protein